MKNFFYILLLIFFSQCRPKENKIEIQFARKPEVPSSIKKTHEFLLERIRKLTLNKDSSGIIALKLEDLMQHHFKEEEDFILPLLGLLPLLANEQMPEQNKELLLLSEKVKSQLNHMSAEHQLIAAYIEELKKASDKESQTEIIEFENEVIEHATSEEEVFFPASILVGEYLKLKLVVKP